MRIEDAKAYLMQLREADAHEEQRAQAAREQLASAEARLEATRRAERAIERYLQRMGEPSAMSEPPPAAVTQDAPDDSNNESPVVVRTVCREFIRERGTAMVQDVVAAVQRVRPDTSRQTVRSALRRLVKMNVIRRTGEATYSYCPPADGTAQGAA